MSKLYDRKFIEDEIIGPDLPYTTDTDNDQRVYWFNKLKAEQRSKLTNNEKKGTTPFAE
jgi:hypothetical protein